LYGDLLGRAAEDVEAVGPVFHATRRFAADPPGSVLPLRLMGAVHRLALSGDAPELARCLPSLGGSARIEETWQAFLATIDRNQAVLESLIAHPVQTNEVGRAAPLLAGFLGVAAEFGLSLRLLELGASAGLNLRWDRFRYESGPWHWGPADSPVVLRDAFIKPPHIVNERMQIVERRGCDTTPLDPTLETDALTLLSYVWADQPARIARLRGAIEIARTTPAVVEAQDALSWLEGQTLLRTGVATVVFHSILLQYMAAESRARVGELMEAAGERATNTSPLAWLSMEPAGASARTQITTWPGVATRVIGTSPFHGLPLTLQAA